MNAITSNILFMNKLHYKVIFDIMFLRRLIMGLFDKLKNIIIKKEIEEKKDDTIKKYDEGLEKSRNEFVSKLSMLGIKYTKIDDEYFDELENILIMADIGVNTVMDFMDRLRKRVKSENITDTKYLNEVIVDELFIIYVNNESITDKINS